MAADVITRFKLETTQFDSKLRDTAKALQNIAHTAQFAGKDFNGFSQKSIEAARALGTVASGATNTKDKLKDLVGSYNDAAKAYDMLSEKAKKGEFGKAMAESLQKLQQDIKQTKDELYGLGDAAKGKGGGLFGGKGFTDMLSVAGGNLLATGFSKITSELADTVQQSIELARSGEGVRLAFERLNKPGLLDNLKEATHGTVSELELMKAAVKFDDFKLPVEQLGTLLAFAQKKAKDTGQSVDYMVDSIVTGLGRKSLMILDNLGLSAAQIKERMAESGDMTKAVADIIKEQMSEAGEYVETAADRAARATAQAQDKMMELGRAAMPVAEAYNEAWGEIRLGAMELMTTVLVPIANFLKQLRAESNMTAEDVLTGGIDDVTDTVDDNGKLIRKNAIASIPEIVVSGNRPKTPKGGKHGPTQEEIAAKIAAQWNRTSLKAGVGADALKGSDIKESMSVWAMMSDETKKSMLGLVDAIEDLGDAQARLGDQKVAQELQGRIEAKNKALEEQAMRYNLAGQAAQNFGSALAGLDDPAAKAAGTVIQAISSIALGFAMASSNANTAGTGWGWLAWLAAGTAAMATTISTIHSLTGYAEGGIVKGNSYSGDNVGGLVDGSQLVGLNAGELVLTKAMQGSLAQSLQNNGQTIRVVGKLHGKDLFICAENWSKSAGHGEFVTW